MIKKKYGETDLSAKYGEPMSCRYATDQAEKYMSFFLAG